MSTSRLHSHLHAHRPKHRPMREDVGHDDRPAHRTSDGGKAYATSRCRSAERGGSSRHRRDTRVGVANGRNASALCAMGAFLALVTSLVSELIAHSRHEPPHLLLSLLASLFALATLATGGYAQTVQLAHWSRRVRTRLLIGMPVGLLALVTATVNVYKQQAPAEHEKPHGHSTALNPRLADEDRSLFKPGWHGEGQENGVHVVVTSFEEHAAEARAFNRTTTEPVTYATLTVINLGSPQPVTLTRTRLTLLLTSGEEVESKDVKPLMRLSALDDRMRQRLAAPRMITPGMMAADIPVCLDSQFRWERVRAVKVSFLAGDLLVTGHLFTADEKRALMEQSSTPKKAVTNLSAEAWFKEM